MNKTITVDELAKGLDLTIIYAGQRTEIDINTSDLNRPGLQMSGFFEYFAMERIQLFGMVEITYLQTMENSARMAVLDTFFSHPIPCVIIGRNLLPPDELLECARKYDVPVFLSGLTTTKISHRTTVFLDDLLAPSISRHGGLMDVAGVGVYITGESGVGKSEVALELVKRGHRFVADDVVEIQRISDNTLIGKSPDIIRHMIEIRGLGIIDVSVMYGMAAILPKKEINLSIHLEPGDIKNIDRIGNQEEYISLLGVNIPQITMPVRPGRNVAVVIEVAALSYRLKSMGALGANDKIAELLGY